MGGVDGQSPLTQPEKCCEEARPGSWEQREGDGLPLGGQGRRWSLGAATVRACGGRSALVPGKSIYRGAGTWSP